MKIHLIGIGGIGISGLARYLMAQGFSISGSDITQSPTIRTLQQQGISITIPHNKDCIKDQDIVIHSAIIKPDNVELQRAQELGIKIFSRAQALEFILKDKRVFSICGAHGKSTTSAMLASIFPEFGAIIGADSKEFGSNVRAIACQSIIFEADESDKSFLNSNPYYAILPNAEPEHMETYDNNLQEFYNAYNCFLDKATKRIVSDSDTFLANITQESLHLNPKEDISHISYFLKDSKPYTRFCLRDFGEFEVYGFGEHTAINASLAILCALDEGKNIQEIKENLKNFAGIKKRFDILTTKDCVIIDDYAHHPTEISATLQSAQIYKNLSSHSHITALWQPHKYSRLLVNLDGFKQCFENLCDELIILPVWCAGEAPQQIDLLKEFAHLNPILAGRVMRNGNSLIVYKEDKPIKHLDSGIIIGLGAGDITYQLRE